MKHFSIYLIIFALFFGCKEDISEKLAKERQNVEIFIQKWIGFVSSAQVEKLDDIFLNDDKVTLIIPESDNIYLGLKNIREYYKNKIQDIDIVDYNLWDKNIYIPDDMKNAYITFKANKKIRLKNGYIVDLRSIKTSIILIKTSDKWKILSIHESVRVK